MCPDECQSLACPRDAVRLLAGLSILLFSFPVRGMSGNEFEIPNGTNPQAMGLSVPCLICHFEASGGARNAFGEDFERTFLWSLIYDLDSDGDGLTNGFELGDPDGVWRPGLVPSRTTNLSPPGGQVPDAGVPPDAGAVEPDSGMEPDTGVLAPDAGVPLDGGVPAPDVGDVPLDAESTPRDAGAIPADTGVVDGGATDSGAATDAESEDAGDASVEYPEVICACARVPRSSSLPMWMVVGAGLIIMLRRRGRPHRVGVTSWVRQTG